MHRRKLRRYRILKELCFAVGSCAFLAILGIIGGYDHNTMSTAEFLMELGIAGETLLLSRMAYDCVKHREQRYIKLRELHQRRQQKQEMKKSA